MAGLIDRNFLNSVSNFLVIYHLLSLKICKRGILLLYLTFIALEVKANCCLCLLPPSAVPGEVPISPLVHVPATVVLISKLATPLFERYLGRSHREPWTGFIGDCMYRKPLGFGESLAHWLFFLQVDGYEDELLCPI